MMTGVIADEAKDRNFTRTHPRARTNATMNEKATTVTPAATVFL